MIEEPPVSGTADPKWSINVDRSSSEDGDGGHGVVDGTVAATADDRIPSIANAACSGYAGSSESGSSNSPLSAEHALRNELKFFFMNPIEKWHVRRLFPFKLITLVIKIVLVTAQLCLFARNRNEHFDYLFRSRVSFSHLFLHGWDTSREVKSYPPASGPLAIYQQSQFYEAVKYSVDGYQNLSNAVGNYSYVIDPSTGKPLPLLWCIENYVREFPNRRTISKYYFNRYYYLRNDSDTTRTDCCSIGVSQTTPFWNCSLVNFDTLLTSTLTFNLKAKRHFQRSISCTNFKITITFDNRERAGRLLLNLEADSYATDCRNRYQIVETSQDFTWHNTSVENWLNYCVIVVCLVSLVLCTRAVYRAQQLKRRTIDYFRTVRKTNLNMECRLQFWNFWYITIIVNDLMIVIGTYLQEEISNSKQASSEWNMCSLLLGTGNLLVWFGVLRYFGFFKTYNVVMITVKSAFPAVMRFMSCAILIYCGFVFCGWLVFGPFHMKFRTLSTTSECLFSLINGDDMFATFSMFEARSTILFFFMRTYVYCFTSLFIYVILSLLLSIIIDAYETIKQYYEQGFPKTEVEKFIAEVDQPSAVFHDYCNGFERRTSFSWSLFNVKRFCTSCFRSG